MAAVRPVLILLLSSSLAACATGQPADNGAGGAGGGGGGQPDAQVSGIPDASTFATPDAHSVADARPGSPDARPGSPDATPAPDAEPPADAGPPSDSGAVVNVCTEAQPYAVNDFCNMAMDLTADAAGGGADVYGDTTNYANDLEPVSSCTSNFGEDGPDAMYRVDASSGQTIHAVVTPVASSFDVAIYILPDCNSATSCLAGIDDVAGTGAETLDFAVTTTGSYYIIVDSYLPSEFGCYELTVALQ